MNARVNAAVMQPTRKIAVTDKRKKEDEGSVFYGLLELGASMTHFLVDGQQDAADMGGRTNLPDVLTSMDGETFEYLGKKGPPAWGGEEWISRSIREKSSGVAGFLDNSSSERGTVIWEKGGNGPGQGMGEEFSIRSRGENGVTMHVGFGPGASIGKVDGWTALAPAGNIQGQERFSKAGQKSGNYMSNHVPEEKKAGEEEGGPMVSSPREAYHIPTSNEPVKIRVAQPYHEYKPEFSRALSSHIAYGLSNSGRTLEIQLEPETLGNILIKFRTGKEGTRVELCCASEKTALLLEKNVSEIGRLIKYHTETPVSIDIRQEETLLLSWNRDQGHSRGRNPENGNGKKKQDGGGRNNEVADFIDKLRLGLEEL